MNNSLAVFLLSDNVRMVSCAYEVESGTGKPVNGKVYSFKTFDTSIAKDDLVVVPTRIGFTVVKVIETDLEVDFSSPIDYTWIVSKFDKADYEALLAQENAAITKIQAAEKAKLKKELRDKLLANIDPNDAGTLLIGTSGATAT